MDIRYISWYGYDFAGPVAAVGTQGPPSIEGKVKGTKKIVATEISPSIRGRMSVQVAPRIVQDDLRPFPGPTNI